MTDLSKQIGVDSLITPDAANGFAIEPISVLISIPFKVRTHRPQ